MSERYILTATAYAKYTRYIKMSQWHVQTATYYGQTLSLANCKNVRLMTLACNAHYKMTVLPGLKCLSDDVRLLCIQLAYFTKYYLSKMIRIPTMSLRFFATYTTYFTCVYHGNNNLSFASELRKIHDCERRTFELRKCWKCYLEGHIYLVIIFVVYYNA